MVPVSTMCCPMWLLLLLLRVVVSRRGGLLQAKHGRHQGRHSKQYTHAKF